MNDATPPLPEVYSARELACAAGVPVRLVRRLMTTGSIPTVDGEFVAHRDALAAVHALSADNPPTGPGGGLAASSGASGAPLFRATSRDPRSVGLPILLSMAVHGIAIAGALLMVTTGARIPTAEQERPPTKPKPTRLVYLSVPGPGGGGGGGGPYRPGSDVQPPRLLGEVKPSYSETARQQGIEGEVVLEIIVRDDGTVGDVRILESLGFGLDERAVDAVRQWRFAPATRLGNPVDVVVEVSVEFLLR